MKSLNRKKGSITEQKAAEFLKKNGYRILQNNFQTRFGEIDIIATKGECIVFVEVKSKGTNSPGEPEQMLNAVKIKKIINTANRFLLENPKIKKQCPMHRVDLIATVFDEQSGQVKRLDHYQNVSVEVLS